MDAKDCEDIDRAMSHRVNAIYRDPKRHQFYSCCAAFKAEDRRGPRGGRIEGAARVCYHCGGKRKGHAAVTEAL